MRELTECCKRTLPAHKVPAIFRFVPSLKCPRPASWCDPVRNVIVTGGTRGLGLAISAVLPRPATRSSPWRESQRGAHRGGCRGRARRGRRNSVPRPGSFRDVRNCRARERAAQVFGPLYGLINNAGLGTASVLATMRMISLSRWYG